MRKKLILTIFTILALTLLVSCKKNALMVQFDTDGGNLIETIEVKKGSYILKPNNPTKEGYEFIEWRLDGVIYDFEQKVKKNLTLVAEWKEKDLKIFEVIFDTNGGSEVLKQEIKDGEKVTKPQNPVKEGFDFVGWNLNEQAFDFSKPITKNLTLVAEWSETIFISVENEEIAIVETEHYQLVVSTNDISGVSYASFDDSIATVDNDGKIIGVSIGVVEIIIISNTNSKITKRVTIIVDAHVYETDEIVLAQGMSEKVTMPIYDDVVVSNNYVLDIDENGLIQTKLKGKVDIVFYNNGLIVKIINVDVVEPLRTIELSGPSEFYFEEEVLFKATFVPLNGYNKFKFIVANEEILTIDKSGIGYPKGAGETTVKIVSLQDESIFDEINVIVKKTILVSDENVSIKIGNWEFKPGIDMYDDIDEAISNSSEDNKIIIHNKVINNEIIINKNIMIIGVNSIVKSLLKIDAKNVVIKDLVFEEHSKIVSTNKAENIVIDNNIIKNITDDFISLSNYLNLVISNNSFDNIEGIAISLIDINSSSKTLIEKNNINNAITGINLFANERMKINSYIKIYRNVLNNVNEGFIVDLNNNNLITNSQLYARFNEITNYNVAIRNKDDNKFEYTFNYFELSEIDFEKFDNVEEKYLLGFYTSKDDILSEDKYKFGIPIIISIDNIIDEIYLGEDFKIEVTLLPYTSSKENLIISLDNYQSAELTNDWRLVPLESGIVNLSIYAFGLKENRMTYKIKVTTEPGIHFEIDNPTHNIKVGDEINISAIPYPFDIEDANVEFYSSDTNIATVNNNGKVQIVGVGQFSIYASINDPVVVQEELIFVSQLNFDENDIMDFITQNQLMYNKSYDIALYGNSIEITTLYEGVSKLVLHNVDKYEDIIPIAPGFRSGRSFSSNIPEEYKYNDENAVWIVVHDTGNNNAGAGAKLHATYLRNQIENNGRKASWHFTVDAKEIYQHMPENEWAYHAGDESSLPGLDKKSPALGGGNTNGISIEMSVQRDGHAFKTWQNTAQLVADLLFRYNLPLTHQKYHNDFSGKECPQTLRRNGFVSYFEELVAIEYQMKIKFASQIKSIEFISHNEEILNNKGMIIALPNKTTTVFYTIKVTTNDDQVLEKNYFTIVEGQWR